MPFISQIKQINRLAFIKRERRGSSLLLAYPTVGLSHRLGQDKQLELAHAVIYSIGTIHPTQTLRCVSSDLLNLRDSTVEDHVRKRPIFNMSTP